MKLAPPRDADDFSPAAYRALVEGFLGAGYRTVDYADAEPRARHLVLRHDIDQSLEAAAALARIEAEIGVRATYFVMVRTAFYNPFSEAGTARLAQIARLGHRIGLHVDAALYGEERAALEAGVAAECAALETILGHDCEMVSFHRPAPALVGDPAPVAGRPHAYMPKFVEELGYCSDSRGQWRHGHPFETAALAEGRALHLLTHPIWWYNRPGADPQEKLDAFLDERVVALRDELGRNVATYDPERPFQSNGQASISSADSSTATTETATGTSRDD